jgi:hypothetical protein
MESCRCAQHVQFRGWASLWRRVWMFRVYAPTKVFFDKTWKLPDIEQIADSTLKGRNRSRVQALAATSSPGKMKQLTKRWGIPLYGSMT